MKKITLLGILLVVFLVNLEDSEAICCEKGCYVSANVCCSIPLGSPSEGYVGCYNANYDDYVCPGLMLGECLKCECVSNKDCEWIEDRPEEVNCNACVVICYGYLTEEKCNNDLEGRCVWQNGRCETVIGDYPTNPVWSLCDDGCPDGKDPCEIEGVPSCCSPDAFDDSDNDGLPDEWERLYFGDLSHGPDEDYDGDGVSNYQEYLQGTDPTKEDTNGDGIKDGDDKDNDGMSDAWELNHGLDPNNPNDANQDPDRDGFTNLEEFRNGTDPHRFDGDSTDSDNDGLPDEWERLYFGDLSHGPDEDYDGDGVSNYQEYLQGTDPTKEDTNGDGIKDGDDKDNDGMSDAWELNHGLDPNNPNDANQDPDRDGFTNLEEFRNGTDPHRFDVELQGEIICNGNRKCEDFESCKCSDCKYGDQAGCLEGLFCSEFRKVCSGDEDGDGILNDDDICIDVYDPDQEDTDKDCYLDAARTKRAPMFGYCGDKCEGLGSCESAYGERQCCDNFPKGTQGKGVFRGYFEDCPGLIGCYDECYRTDAEGNIITYNTGACIDGKRVVQEFTNGVLTNSWTEDCMGIPLVPFFSTINILITVLILIGYYSFRRREDSYY